MSTSTSKYSIKSDRGTGTCVVACTYPDSNSGFGKRWACVSMERNERIKTSNVNMFLLNVFIYISSPLNPLKIEFCFAGTLLKASAGHF